MVNKDDALKLALEALEHEADKGNDDAYKVERDAIKEALAQTEQSVVRMPTSSDEAAAMQMLGFAYLQHHAPERLAQPEQEPVYLAWFYEEETNGGWFETTKDHYDITDEEDRWLLYTTPPKREWVGLTDAEMFELGEFRNFYGYVPTSAKRLFARVEAALKEKNI